MVLKKRRLRRVWHQTRNPSDKTSFNKACKDLKVKLADLRSKAVGDYLTQAAPNAEDHNLWNATRYLKRPIKTNATIKRRNGQWCRSNEEIAQEFAEHLANTFTNFRICSAADETEIRTFLDSPCQMDLPITATDEAEVRAEILRLNDTKSPGYDEIDARVLKKVPHSCIQLIKKDL